MTRRSVPGRLLDAWGDPLGPCAETGPGTLLFLFLVAFVAFYDLGSRSLHTLDLPRFGVLAREMLRTGEWLVPVRYGEVYANKPPLTIWLVAGPAALVGEVTPFLVRLPSALGLVLLALSASAWGRLRTGSFAVGRAAALLLLGTYAVTRFGREGRPDMLAAGLSVAGTWLLDRAASRAERTWDPWLAGLLLGLALLAKGPVYLLFPLLVLLLPGGGIPTRRRIGNARPLVVVGVAVVVAALWFVPATATAGWAYGRTLLLDQASTRLAGEANHAEPVTYYFERLVDGGAPWSPLYVAVLLLLASRFLRDTRSLGFAALVALVLFSLVPTKHLRYVLPVFVLLAVPAGWILHRFLDRGAGRLWPRLLPAAALGAALAAAACAFWSARADVALLPLLPPILLLLALAASALSAAALGTTAEPARRRVVGGLLLCVVLLLGAYWIVRDRYRVRTRDAFDRAVAAALVGDAPVFTLAPVEPGQVFHAAPDARLAREPSGLPAPGAAPRLLVLARPAQRAAAEARRGEPGRVLLEQAASDDGEVVLLLGFGIGG